MKGATVSVTTSATLIVDASKAGTVNFPFSVLIKNPSGGQTVYLGGSTVDSTGYQLASGDIISIDLVGQALYGIVAATTQSVYILTREG